MDDRTMYPTSLLSFLLGSLAGASLALLFAPQSGRDTRSLVSRRMKGGVDRARELKERVASRARLTARDAKSSLESVERDLAEASGRSDALL